MRRITSYNVCYTKLLRTAVFSLPKSSSSQANATAKTATAIQSKIDFIDTDFNKMGPEVRSLAELNASYAWQWSSHPRKQGMAVMVMSDGVNDCFNKENLTAFCSSLITIPIKYGTAYLDRIMPEELKGKAEQSSRDDASLALWIDGILLRYVITSYSIHYTKLYETLLF